MTLPAALLVAPSWLPDPGASARVIAQLYTLVLIVTALLLLTGLAALALRRAPAGTRVLVWRAAVLAVLAASLGHLLPIELWTGTIPAIVADPLVRLGRLQVAVAESAASGSQSTVTDMVAPHAGDVLMIRLLVTLYGAGVALLLLGAWRANAALGALARRARTVRDPKWLDTMDAMRRILAIERPIRLLETTGVAVPVTWGLSRPVVVLPHAARRWSGTRRRAVLLHELAHVGAADTLFAHLATLMCAFFWFHPGVWWLARRLRTACELAADDRVLAHGIRASDYAEILIRAADSAATARRPPFALALARRTGLRERLAAIVDVRRDLRAPGHTARHLAMMITLAIAVPAGASRLAPSRDVLTALLREPRWDSRAYAVVGLAQRPDSIEVARAASRFDPSPRVRAWARRALDRASNGRPLPLPLNELPALPNERH